jgi:hypothetical protein
MEFLKSDIIPMFVNLAQDEQVNNVTFWDAFSAFLVLTASASMSRISFDDS